MTTAVKKSPVEARIDQFVEKVGEYPELEIDGLTENGLKILNHKYESADDVSVLAMIKDGGKDIDAIVEALVSRVSVKLYGITRIVGYYSRTSNWNKGKLGELKDRHKGNYSVGNLPIAE